MTYLLVLLVSLLALSGCGSEKEESDNDPRPPTVQAGPDQTAHPGMTVILSGTAGDSGGTTLSYLWQQTSGPFVALTGADTLLSATFTAPNVSIDQTLTFRLTVASDLGASASDQISVTILAKTPPGEAAVEEEVVFETVDDTAADADFEPGPANRLPIIGLPAVEQAGDVTRNLGDPTKDLDLFEIDYESDDYVCTHTDPDAQGFTYFNVFERGTYNPPLEEGVFVIGGTVSTNPPGIIAFEISCSYQTVTPVAPGTTTVTITLTNASGATTTTSFKVTIQDLNRATLNALGHTCTNEADDAGLYATLPWIWDGTVSPVDVSSAFENAEEIMDEVEDAALSIHRALGYWILTPGEIIDMEPGPEQVWDITLGDETYEVPCCIPDDILHPVPEGRVHIRCCIIDDLEDDLLFNSGFARLGQRLVVLAKDMGTLRICRAGGPCWTPSEHATPHELWHLLGFGHPGEFGVPMSETLMWLTGKPSTIDMARLACIYD